MPFVPLSASFPRVSPDEQAARDADAEQIVRAEFDQEMPDENRDALEAEYQQRFGKSAPVQRGFIPLANAGDVTPQHGFIPLADDKPSLLKTIALNNPATAIVETGANLLSQGVALPVAGLAGLAAVAGNALGLTDKEPADVVHAIGGALTYQPRGEYGKATTAAVMTPFEKLAEAGQGAGNWVLDQTGSPIAATAVDTAVNALPMAIAPAVKGAKAIKERMAPRAMETPVEPVSAPYIPEADAAMVSRPGFVPLTESMPDVSARTTVTQLVESPEMVQKRTADMAFESVAQAATVDEAIALASRSIDTPLVEAKPIAVEVPIDIPPGRFSRPSYTDDLLGRLERIASPGPRMEIQAELQRRSLLAGRVAEEHRVASMEAVQAEAMARQQAEAPAPALEGGLRDDFRQRGIPLAKILDHEDGVALRVPKAADETLVFGGIEQANRRAVAEGWRPAENKAAMLEEGNPRIAESLDSPPALAHEQPPLDAVGAAPLAEPLAKTGETPAGGRLTPIQETMERQAIPESSRAPSVEPLTVSVNKGGNAIISGDAARMAALESDIQQALNNLTILRQRGSDGSISLIVSSKTDPAMVRSAVEAINNRGTPAAPGFVPLHEMAVGMDRRVASAEFSNAGESRIPNTTETGYLPKQENLVSGASGEAPSPRITQDMAAGVQNGTWNPGANYAPFVDQARTPASNAKTVADLPDPIRREHIIKDFADAIDTTIYEGRVKGGKRLGFFRPGVDEVRIKNANDVEVAAHEIAHLIDHRIPEIQRAYFNDKALREELKSVSYDQKSVKEGFAEGVRLFLTQPETLEARAPGVHAWLEDFAANNERYGPALRKAQEQMTGWFGQDALNRARSKIGSDQRLSEYFDGFWDKFRQSTVDDLHGIYRMERDMTGKISPNGPYESARLSRSSASVADGAVRFGYPVKNPDGSLKFAGKGLEEILQPVSKGLDDALLYFVGRSARELQMQGRERLFTKGEVDAMLGLRTPERDKAFADYQAWNKGILDFAEAQGVINPESRRLWQRTQYMPFHRVDQAGGLKGKPGEWAGIQALTGGTTNIKDVLGNMVGNAAMLLDKAVKNEARLKVARLSQMVGGAKFMAKIDTEARPVKIAGDQVLEAMLKKYGIAIDGDAPAFFEFLIRGQPPAGKNVVAVLDKGKPVWWEVGDPILYRALSAIDRPVQSEVVRWLGLPKRVGQTTITLTADFMMANIARDTLMGSVMSRSGFRPILDSLQGMRLRMTSDPLYKDYIANGGGLSSIYLDETALRSKMKQFYGRQGIDYKTVLDTPEKLLHGIETIADAFEMSTRLGEYRRAIQRGENPRHAAYQGREVSTDFAMKGDSKALGFMYDTVMFLRPAVVSWDRLYRGVAHDPNKGAIAAKAGTVALLSAGLYLLNRDDPRYADLPDWDRDTNWHFFVGEHHFRYPKIWEIGSIASLAERSVEKLLATDPEGLGKDMVRIVSNTFHLNLTPQILAPLVEQATNRNSFTKAPIETPGMENVQPFLRSKPGTSETMKAAGMATRNMPEVAQINPARAEALLRGYFNTWALYGLMLSDQAMFSDKLPEKRTDELPVVRRFYANEPAKHTKYETMFYDLLQESKRLRGTMRELDEMNLRTYADEKEKSPLATEAKPLERAAKNLGVINKDMEQVRRSDATPAAKREKLDALTIERNALLKAAVTDSQQAQQKEHAP